MAGRPQPLTRAFWRNRFREYRSLLRIALSQQYEVIPLEAYLDRGGSLAPRTLILRHDVDQHPGSVLPMLDIEQALGLRSTWYFRWRTADPEVIRRVRARGGEVGLHYETLTRRVIERRIATGSDLRPELELCRAQLKREIEAFAQLFGATRSVCAHGDTRAAGVRNLQLLEGQNLEEYGIRFDANLSLRRHSLSAWVTDRYGEGGWSDGQDLHALLLSGASPILGLTHPNNWAGGVSLWADRAVARVLPRPEPGRRVRVIRSRSDLPAAA